MATREERQEQSELNMWVDIEAKRVKIRTEEEALVLMNEVAQQNFVFQAKFFMNAYPSLSEEDKEKIFKDYVPGMQKLDYEQCTDPYNYIETGMLIPEKALMFVEKHVGGITKLEFEKEMSEIDSNRDGKLSLIEFLLWPRIFKNKTVWDMCSRTQINDISMSNAQIRLNNAMIKKENHENLMKAQQELAKSPKKATAIKAQQEYERLKNAPEVQAMNEEIKHLDTKLLKAIAAAKKLHQLPNNQHCFGAVWWNARELAEKKINGPQKKQGKR